MIIICQNPNEKLNKKTYPLKDYIQLYQSSQKIFDGIKIFSQYYNTGNIFLFTPYICFKTEDTIVIFNYETPHKSLKINLPKNNVDNSYFFSYNNNICIIIGNNFYMINPYTSKYSSCFVNLTLSAPKIINDILYISTIEGNIESYKIIINNNNNIELIYQSKTNYNICLKGIVQFISDIISIKDKIMLIVNQFIIICDHDVEKSINLFKHNLFHNINYIKQLDNLLLLSTKEQYYILDLNDIPLHKEIKSLKEIKYHVFPLHKDVINSQLLNVISSDQYLCFIYTDNLLIYDFNDLNTPILHEQFDTNNIVATICDDHIIMSMNNYSLIIDLKNHTIHKLEIDLSKSDKIYSFKVNENTIIFGIYKGHCCEIFQIKI